MLNSLVNENDYFKNALSDDGHLALSVSYTDLTGVDAGHTGTAVIITQVPEPTSIVLSCPRFLWTAICLTGGSDGEIPHEQNRPQGCG